MPPDNDGSSDITVLLATPRPVLAEGLKLLLAELNWSPLRILKKLADLPKFAKREQPALILIDAEWPNDEGLFPTLATLQERQPASKPVLLFETLQPPLRMRALLAGCTAIIDCKHNAEQWRSDLQQIAALPQPQPWGELGRLYQYLVHPVEKLPACENLSTRECQVLRLLGWGLSNEEIARALQLSVETVKEHVRRLFKKKSFTDRTQAAVWAVRHGLIDFAV
jgi:NarL family two-component system response regulator LiaR